jgi:hypothetical protein
MITKVFLRGTDQHWIYTLPPEKALRACYCQQVFKRYDTWNYDFVKLPEFVRNGDELSCGKFVVSLG